MKHVAVLVSGGVDSSVALRLLQEQNYKVTAFYLKIWLEDELAFLGTCPWQEDLNYVTAVCEQAGVPLEVISLQSEYLQEVVTYTLGEIKAGRTPNPDVMCNNRIKFGAFYKKIGQEYDFVATGHYAQIQNINNKIMLKMAPDAIKDQTYFLSHLTQEQLARAIFPIGHLNKSQVRELADTYNLPNKSRKDSQGICFLGKLKFSEFINYHLGQKPGDLIEFETGNNMGKHNGFWYYTIGQRQGLGLGGGPWYVVAKDTEKNIVYISKSYYTQDKARDTFIIEACNWFNYEPEENKVYNVKLRHGAHINTCKLTMLTNGKFNVQLSARDQGIASGQFAVFYDDNICLGSGIIS